MQKEFDNIPVEILTDSLKLYIKEISAIPLLTKEEELH